MQLQVRTPSVVLPLRKCLYNWTNITLGFLGSAVYTSMLLSTAVLVKLASGKRKGCRHIPLRTSEQNHVDFTSSCCTPRVSQADPTWTMVVNIYLFQYSISSGRFLLSYCKVEGSIPQKVTAYLSLSLLLRLVNLLSCSKT